MRIVKSNLLKDGKMYNDGRPVDLIQIENDGDFDILLSNILDSNYYDNSYFKTHIDYPEGWIKFDDLFLASIIQILNPGSILELGCGRGDVLFLLSLRGNGNVQGIEFSQDVLKKSWPPLADKIAGSDILEACKVFQARERRFDTICAFDLWEHLHPKKLHEYIDSVVALAEKDALFFFTIPAFGEDRVFGEIFPLQLEENREKFNRRLPFDFLNAESLNPIIPTNGHLIWAHTEWWQNQFKSHRLFRSEELERKIHFLFDEHLFYARKNFYLFHNDSKKARNRIKNLLRTSWNLFQKWKIFQELQASIEHFQKNPGTFIIDSDELRATVHHAEFHMVPEMELRRQQWDRDTSLLEKKWVRIHSLFSSLTRQRRHELDEYVAYLERQKISAKNA